MTNNKGLLAVSFGTSYPDTRRRTVESVESDLRRAFPDRRFYRAWTSIMLRRKVERTEGLRIPSVEEALTQMAADGVTDALVQTTHLLAGEEFQKMQEAASSHAGQFDTLAMGAPLVSDEEDVAALAKAVEQIYGEVPAHELLVFMGHGSDCMTFPVYEHLQRQFRRDGYDNICIGTVEFSPGIAPVLRRVREQRPARVHLAPLLLASGDHAINDMAGDAPDSWKNQIARLGADVVCHLNGLGEYEAVRSLYVAHARCARAIRGKAAV